jgi:hypothetical protein
MSIWDAFIDDYEHRRKNLLKRIQLMEARLLRTGNSELGRWITTTADSLAQAKVDLAEIERLLEEAKAKLRSGISRPAALKFSPLTVRQPVSDPEVAGTGRLVVGSSRRQKAEGHRSFGRKFAENFFWLSPNRLGHLTHMEGAAQP